MLVRTGGVSKLGADLLVWVSCDKRLGSPQEWTGVCVQAHPGLGGCLCLRHSEQQGHLQDRLAGALVLAKMFTGSALSFNNPG